MHSPGFSPFIDAIQSCWVPMLTIICFKSQADPFDSK
jgi:hypothetical protein